MVSLDVAQKRIQTVIKTVGQKDTKTQYVDECFAKSMT